MGSVVIRRSEIGRYECLLFSGKGPISGGFHACILPCLRLRAAHIPFREEYVPDVIRSYSAVLDDEGVDAWD
jgi:hypothetical protein